MSEKSRKRVPKKVTKPVPEKSTGVGSKKPIEKVVDMVTNPDVIPMKPKKIKMKVKSRAVVIKEVSDADV